MAADSLTNGSQVCGINASTQLEHKYSLTAQLPIAGPETADQMKLGRTLGWPANLPKISSSGNRNSYRPDLRERVQLSLTISIELLDFFTEIISL
jgi:hypothetical protein